MLLKSSFYPLQISRGSYNLFKRVKIISIVTPLFLSLSMATNSSLPLLSSSCISLLPPLPLSPMAAAGGSLKNIFEKTGPDSISSWAQFVQKAEAKETSFDIFGEICHPVRPEAELAPEPEPNSKPDSPLPAPSTISPRRLDKSSSWSSSRSMEEAAVKNFPDVIDLQSKPLDRDSVVETAREKKVAAGREKVKYGRSFSDARFYGRSRSMNNSSRSMLPPPITSIGRFGKPRVYFKSNKEDGRFVLREVQIPTQRLLQATREDGRLRMKVVSPVEEVAGREDGNGEEEQWK